MKSKDIRNLAKEMRNNGKSYGDISAALHITRQSARHLCKYEIKISKMKRGPKEKITGFNSYRVHREIQNIKKFGENIWLSLLE